MLSGPGGITRSKHVLAARGLRWRWEATGIYACLMAWCLYSQLLWSELNHDYQTILPRLLAAGAVGGLLAWCAVRALRWWSLRRGDTRYRAIKRLSIILSPTVLVLLSPLHHAFLLSLLLGPPLTWLAITIQRGLRTQGRSYLKLCLFRALGLALGLFLALAAGEALLWAVYHDFRASSSRSPGLHRVHLSQTPLHRPLFSARGPSSQGLKPAGVRRILVQGDSVTCGVLADWRQGFPNQLMTMLRRKEPGRWQMDVLAKAGWEIGQHLYCVKKLGRINQPDVIIYAWYVNDVELDKSRRPHSQATVWWELPWHQYLWDHSYLYRFLDINLEQLLPRMAPTYLEYLAHEYRSGTFGWLAFELYFRMWLTRAGQTAPRVLIYMYPALPRDGLGEAPYALAGLHEQVRQAAAAEKISYPAWFTAHKVGMNVTDPHALYPQVRAARASSTEPGVLVDGPLGDHLDLPPGRYQADFLIKADHRPVAGRLALARVIGRDGDTLAQREVWAYPGHLDDDWQVVTVPFQVIGETGRGTRLQIQYLGGGDLYVDRVTLHWPLPVAPEVIDGLDSLRHMQTWANAFDGHPNAETNQVIARTLYQALERPAFDHRGRSVH